MKINICRVQVMMRKYLRSYGHEARGSPEYVCKYKSNTNLLLEMFITCWGGGGGGGGSSNGQMTMLIFLGGKPI